MEKDASEAIRSVVETLPNIDKLKPEQEQALLSFVGGHDVVALIAIYSLFVYSLRATWFPAGPGA